MKKLVLVVLAAAAASTVRAASYVEQATFNVAASTIAGLDRDSVGNLYVLMLAAGATTYSVTGYRTPALEPLFSFDTGVRAPLAFAIEPSGVVNVLEGGGGITLKRFLNTGYFLGQSTYSLGAYISTTSLLSAAFDKTNARLHLSFQNQKNYYCPLCLGCSCPPSGMKGYVNAYDFSGNLLSQVEMAGISATPTSCYTPSKIAVGALSELVIADTGCQKILRYSRAGALEGQTSAPQYGGFVNLRNMWLDADSSLYASQMVCGPGGCPWGVVKVSADGSLMTSLTADSTIGTAWDGRILYLSSAGRSPLRRLVFNEPPSVPAGSAPLGSVVQHSSAAWMRWQSSSDNDGDPLLYTIEFGTLPFVLRSTGTSETSQFFTAPLSFGTTYYWRVTARDSYLGLPLQSRASSVENFVLGLTNAPPAPFTVVSGSGIASTRETSVVLSWTRAIDPDGDAVSYTLSWRPAGQILPSVSVTTATSSQPLTGLTFGTTYFWSVTARDGYGAARELAAGATQFYQPVFRNAPPPVPAVIAGAGSSLVHALSPQALLSWSSVEDPDGDAVGYRLAVGTSPAALASVQDSTVTAYALAPSYGTTYYWQVTAYDAYGGAGTAPVTSILTLLRNSPPEPFSILTGSVAVVTRASSWPLSWQASLDADGDAVSYELSLTTSALSLAVVQASTATSYSLGFQYGATYYWQVTARDGFGGATPSVLQVFRAEFMSVPPGSPKLSAPFMTTPTIKTMRDGVEITWDKVTNPQGDAITYIAYLGDSPAGLRAVASVVQAPGAAIAALPATGLGLRPFALAADQGDKVKLTLSGLDYYRSYYFQVSAQNPYGAASRTPIQAFNLAPADSFPRVYNYPNPFSSNRGGTNVVFNAPPSGYSRAVLVIYSEFGQKLYQRDFGTVPPGISQVRFDGRDQQGRALMNGSYVARVHFYGPSETATFFLLVVK